MGLVDRGLLLKYNLFAAAAHESAYYLLASLPVVQNLSVFTAVNFQSIFNS